MSTKQSISMTVCMDAARGIGNQGHLPWPGMIDKNAFLEQTLYKTIIMGRKTWDSLKGPLKNRTNFVVSRTLKSAPGITIFDSLESAILEAKGSVVIIGGAEIYKEGLKFCDEVRVTEIQEFFRCDTYMPKFESNFKLITSYLDSENSHIKYHRYVRLPHPEHRYLDLIREIFKIGIDRPDRTGTGTLSVFGRQMRFDLRESFPLLTTKKVFFKAVVHELLWFLSGSTNNKILQFNGVHIWDGNASPEYLDKLGLKYPEGELGPIYGFQWRQFGATHNPDGHLVGGVDQIKDLIENIKKDPFSRRHIISAWNPVDIPKMAIPPCHVMCQFYVRPGTGLTGQTGPRYLDCQLYQRSGDMGLGVPFNIASYSLLTYIVAHCCDLTPGEFIHVLGDAHIYNNHIEALKTQLIREPFDFPKLKILSTSKNIFDLKFDDIQLVGYESHSPIKMDLSV